MRSRAGTSQNAKGSPKSLKAYEFGRVGPIQGSECQPALDLMHTYDLGWTGRLSRPKKLEPCLLNIGAPPIELGPFLFQKILLCVD